jgi:membrane fusion protein (multidrug efflux system)
MLPLALLAGCTGEAQQPAGPPTPTVGVITVTTGDVSLETVLTGRAVASTEAEVRPQVSGIVRERLFREGSFVRAGQPLYRIDAALYRAAVNESAARLASARAAAGAAQARARRFRSLDDIEAVSRQERDDAVAQAGQAQAAVAEAQAALATSRIQLGYATVTAPISGIIGRSAFTRGALVTASQAEPLALIQQLDPVYVDINQSSGDFLALRRKLAQGELLPASAEARIVLEDGTPLAQAGTVSFAEPVVDEASGTVTIRVTVPNPDGTLVPGMFVRVVLTEGVRPNAILVPQQAVDRAPNGSATVMVVGRDNKVALRRIVAERAIGANWLVREGLRPGDRVVTEGTGAARPGMTVKVVPAGSAQRVVRPPAGAGGGGR